MTGAELIKWIVGILGSLSVLYLWYGYITTQTRIKSLEDDSNSQKVKNTEFSLYQEYKNKKDDEFRESIDKICTKIDELKESFTTKFEELHEDIHKLELQFAGENKTKK